LGEFLMGVWSEVKSAKEVLVMGWRRALETPEFVVEERDDTPATTRRFRIWRNRSPFAEVTVRVDFEGDGNRMKEDIVIQPLIFRYRRNPAVSAALDPQELLRVVLEALPAELRR
jgi:hypothetical protein